jgi:hypothetical protein
MRGAILDHMRSLLHAQPTRGLVPGTARLDLAETLVALDFVDVRNCSAITTSVLATRVFLTLETNAATARFESSQRIKALATAHASEDVAELHASARAHRNGTKDGHSALRGLGSAPGRAGVRSQTCGALGTGVSTNAAIATGGAGSADIVESVHASRARDGSAYGGTLEGKSDWVDGTKHKAHTMVEVVPPTQTWQDEAPVMLENVPTGQDMQAVAPSAE